RKERGLPAGETACSASCLRARLGDVGTGSSLLWPTVSCAFAAPDEEVQTTRDDGALCASLAERVQPSATFPFRDHAGSHGYLGAPLGHVGVETLQISLNRKEPANSNISEPGGLE